MPLEAPNPLPEKKIPHEAYYLLTEALPLIPNPYAAVENMCRLAELAACVPREHLEEVLAYLYELKRKLAAEQSAEGILHTPNNVKDLRQEFRKKTTGELGQE
jgi:hypothetical protein